MRVRAAAADQRPIARANDRVWRSSASSKGWHVQWETVPPEEQSGTFVAWVASVEETKRMKPTDEAIFRMASESPGRNASEPSGGLDKN